MHSLKKSLISLWGEILVLLVFMIVSASFLGDRSNLIEADGRGYYEFLPAIFIYNDLELNYLDTLKSEYYNSELMSGDFYKRLENGKRFDKYFIGTAVLQTPFFAAGHIWAKFSDQYEEDGFSRPYQLSIYAAALFYTFLGLLFMRLLLTSYAVNRYWILAVQAGVVFCTSLLNYMHWDAAYSHVYSFFLISGFLYFARIFLVTNSGRSLFWTVFFLGTVLLVRPVNGWVLLFVLMLSEDFKSFIKSFKSLFNKHLKVTIISVLTAFIILQIQCLVWYFQTGHWIYYAYGEETFIWSDPHIMDFLFSYRKGFFLWAPWFLVILVSGIVFHTVRKMWFRLVWFCLVFLLLVYVLSSWWCWSYGGSMGSRPMIDFYPAIIAFAAPMFAIKTGFAKWIVLLLTPLLACVMLIQVYQYQFGILTYDEMKKDGYWKVFLKTAPMYEYYLWKTEIPLVAQISETNWEKHKVMDPQQWYVFDTIRIVNPADKEVKTGQLTWISPRKNGGEALEIRLLDMNDSLVFNHYSTMLHVIDESKGNQLIDYRFQVDRNLPAELKAVFVIYTQTESVAIDSMKIRFFTD